MTKNRLLLLPMIAACVALASCATVQKNPLATWVPSKNYDIRKPVLIVVHFTEEDSAQQALDTLRSQNSGGKVSAHYLVGKDGTRYQLVDERKRAWQAGAGSWGPIRDLNSVSLGIEIDNNGHEPYPDVQIQSLIALLDDMCKRWNIPRTAIIGHADLAPGRKPDPGKFFPWKRLHDAGFGLWPSDDLVDPPQGFDAWRALAQVGYSLKDRAGAVKAFHQHFRGDDGNALDAEDARILYSLTQPDGVGTEAPATTPAVQ